MIVSNTSLLNKDFSISPASVQAVGVVYAQVGLFLKNVTVRMGVHG